MAFEKKQFEDGEIVFSPPLWRKQLEELEQSIKPTPFGKNREKEQYGKDEVGLRHPKNGSYIRITDEGGIEAFTAYGTGLRIRPDNTIQLFGDRVQFVGREMETSFSPNGVNWKEETPYPTYPKTKGLSRDFLKELEKNHYETYETEEWK